MPAVEQLGRNYDQSAWKYRPNTYDATWVNRHDDNSAINTESEEAGSDDVDCIRDNVCSLCPRVASGRLLSAYETSGLSPDKKRLAHLGAQR